MGCPRIFVLGWYAGESVNLGDEAFKPSFKKLWKNVEFTFGNSIPKDINSYDYFWIGGGSFLDQPLSNPHHITVKKPIGIIGVGISTIHPKNKAIVDSAKIIVVRDKSSQSKIPNSIYAPDIVFSLEDSFYKNCQDPSGKKITILLSDFISPQEVSQAYSIAAFNWFVIEFASFCDLLVDKKYQLEFVPMCFGAIDDRRISAAIISRMKNKSKVKWCLENLSIENLRIKISESNLVITQRFHGMIFSTLSEVNFINIRFHDKMLSLMKDMNWNSHIDYYGFNKIQLMSLLNSFDNSILKSYTNQAQENLKCMSAIVAKQFSL
jgi:polysaccharide pyruvyl transferase WcaK-like protein